MTSSSEEADLWAELGLDGRPDNAGALRRAFAGKLRSFDVDAEPQRFIRLRRALEDGLRLIEAGVPPPPTPRDEPHRIERRWTEFGEDQRARPMPPPLPRPPRPEREELHRVSGRQVAAFRSAFAAAVADGRLGLARDLYREGLAQALIPLGEEVARLADLIRLALADPQASVADIRALAAEHALAGGVNGGLPQPVAKALRARLAAEDWYEAKVKLARRLPIWQPFPSRAARLVIGRWRPWRLSTGDISWVRGELPGLRLHGPLLGSRIDPARADALQRRIDWLSKPGPFRRVLLWVIAGAIALSVLRALIESPHH